MSGAEWERVKVIFDAAVAVAEDEREAFVQIACSSHPQLYLTLVDLIRNHTESLGAALQTAETTAGVFDPGVLVGGRFRVVRFVSQGGMGEVYECYDEALSARVALKTLRPEFLEDPRAVARFKREIHVARAVSHHNVCRIHELVEHVTSAGRRIPCLTMEFLEGETLAASISRLRPFEATDALPVICQIAEGLEALHARGVLHRDLKPSNIMLVPEHSETTRAVLMDFGLAKVSEGSSDIFETSLQSQPAGAPYFMAPELLRGEGPTVASDIYSFGLVVDEMMTRTRAYSAVSLQALYYAKLWEKPITPSQRSEHLPGQWQDAILRCLDAEPGRRFPSAEALVGALTTRDSPGSSLQRRGRRIARRIMYRPGWVVAALVLGVVSGISAAMVYAPPAPIAVFNIRNSTGEPEYNYLATGFTSEISRRLGLVPGIHAFPIHQIFSQKATLPTRFNLEGQLTVVGGKTWLLMSLRDQRRSETPIWSRSFGTQQLSNPLQIESEILSAVISKLEAVDLRNGAVLFLRTRPPVVSLVQRWSVISGRAVASSSSPTSNNGAFDDFMRGRQLTEQMLPDAIRNGQNLLERAVSEDPGFALAYAALANASITMMNWNYVPQETLLANADSFAKTAVELDPNLPEALQARALVRQNQWDWNGAKQDYLQALALKPTFAIARRYYAILVTLMGDPEEGVRQSRLALAADPYDYSALPGHALILYTSGRLLEAASTLENSPNQDSLGVRRNLGETYALLGAQSRGSLRDQYFRESLEQAEKVRKIESRSETGRAAQTPEADRMFAHFLAMQGNLPACQPYLARLEIDFREKLISPATLAWVYTALGRKQEALNLLERALEERDRHLIFIKVYPFLNALRSDVRFQRILTRMAL